VVFRSFDISLSDEGHQETRRAAEKNATTNILEGRTDESMNRGKTVYAPPVERGIQIFEQKTTGLNWIGKIG
jgi:hypothetical protein